MLLNYADEPPLQPEPEYVAWQDEDMQGANIDVINDRWWAHDQTNDQEIMEDVITDDADDYTSDAIDPTEVGVIGNEYESFIHEQQEQELYNFQYPSLPAGDQNSVLDGEVTGVDWETSFEDVAENVIEGEPIVDSFTDENQYVDFATVSENVYGIDGGFEEEFDEDTGWDEESIDEESFIIPYRGKNVVEAFLHWVQPEYAKLSDEYADSLFAREDENQEDLLSDNTLFNDIDSIDDPFGFVDEIMQLGTIFDDVPQIEAYDLPAMSAG